MTTKPPDDDSDDTAYDKPLTPTPTNNDRALPRSANDQNADTPSPIPGIAPPPTPTQPPPEPEPARTFNAPPGPPFPKPSSIPPPTPKPLTFDRPVTRRHARLQQLPLHKPLH